MGDNFIGLCKIGIGSWIETQVPSAIPLLLQQHQKHASLQEFCSIIWTKKVFCQFLLCYRKFGWIRLCFSVSRVLHFPTGVKKGYLPILFSIHALLGPYSIVKRKYEKYEISNTRSRKKEKYEIRRASNFVESRFAIFFEWEKKSRK